MAVTLLPLVTRDGINDYNTKPRNKNYNRGFNRGGREREEIWLLSTIINTHTESSPSAIPNLAKSLGKGTGRETI